ncbi:MULTISPECIES: Do family serine endopeptidase [unclassified Luteimonas]
MKARIPVLILVLATAATTAAVILPSATAEPAAQEATSARAAQAAAPELVTGLPDFTRLVEQVGPGVVSIEATITGRTAQRRAPSQDMFPEIFRRFFGPGFSMPDAPGGPQAPAPRGLSMGTGFLISEDGYLLTNHHVVANADEVRVRLHDQRQYDAEVIGSDEQSDVAVLKIEADDLTVLRPGDAGRVRAGQWAVAIGSPFGLEQSVTAGIVSAVGRSNRYANQQYVPFIQTDVAINRGNSGGPLLNTRGEVIGINSQIFSNSGGYQGVSFAIPIDIAMNVAEQIKDTGSVQRGLVGVNVGPVSRDAMAGFDLPDTRGALVIGVQPDSPAEDAGIEIGDVIRAVDGTAVVQASDLPPIVGNMAPGTKVRLEVFREGRTRNFDVTLAALDDAALAGPASGPARGQDARPDAAESSNPLGLVATDLTDAQRRQAGLADGEGVRIVRVEGLAARSAGIQPGDVISRVGRTAVGSAQELDRQLRDVKPGQTVMLLRHRGGGAEFVAVTPRDSDD